jgi:predicted amidohydrolase
MNSGENMEQNIVTACVLIRKAKQMGADFIALPENVSQMRKSGDSYAHHAHREADHPALQAFLDVAKEVKAYILVGSLAVRCRAGEKLANRSFLINPEGEVVARYDKIHLFDTELPDGRSYKESEHFVNGKEAVVVDTPWGGLGMTVCYDVRFPHLFRALAQKGAKFITVPSAFTQVTGEAHWHVLLRARAIETGSYIIAPAQYGMHPGDRKTYGHAIIIDPWGKVLAEASGDKEEVIVADVDTAYADKVRASIPAVTCEQSFCF